MSENPKSIILIQSYGEKLALKDRFLAEGTINIGILGKKQKLKYFLNANTKSFGTSAPHIPTEPLLISNNKFSRPRHFVL